MKILSFNVNGIRARIESIKKVVELHDPDVIGLQETKVADESFPVEQIETLGYKVFYHGQKMNHGVAIMSKKEPKTLIKGMPTDTADMQKRLISAEFEGKNGQRVWIVNSYFPQGENRSHAVKFPYKEKYYADLYNFLQSKISTNSNLILMGDFNVAPKDMDIGIGEANAQRWLKTGKTCFLPEERQWFEKLVSLGLFDTWREQNPNEAKIFTWFDYRSKGFEDEPKRGLRIDFILATKNLLEHLTKTSIDYETRSLERPSDHCPVLAEFDI